jgi:[acyl-carrier-protein] S-malonyltransferase
VISGDVEAVQKAMQAAREIGAKRAIELQVSGAFHSELMKPAQAALADAIEDIVFSAPDVPVVPNVTAEPCLDPVELKSLLIDQIISPVKWSDSMTKLAGMGMQRAFEVGPGNTLKTLMRRIDKTINVSSAGTLADLEDLSI